MKKIALPFRNALLLAVIGAGFIFMASCSKDKDATPAPDDNGSSYNFDDYGDPTVIKPAALTHKELTDLFTDGYVDENNDTTNHYVLLNLESGKVVSPKDSATTKWDIGFYNPGVFSGTDIILNSGIHGPGEVEGQTVDKQFDEVTEAPEDGYQQDSEEGNVFTNLSNYTGGPRHVIVPKETETYIIHTNEDTYVKLKFISLYKGNPGATDPDFDYKSGAEIGYYTIEYTIQENGSRRFSEDDGGSGDKVNYARVEDLKANPQVRDPETGNVIDAGDDSYTLFRFSDGAIIPNSDSATGKWDIGFRNTGIILNSGISGPGKVEGQVVKDIFEKLAAAPADGYKQDGADGTVFSDWYNYNSSTHVITTEPGYLLVIHTNDDKYVKMEIQSYYKGSPDDLSTYAGLESSYYTFRYFIQQDGSTSFAIKK